MSERNIFEMATRGKYRFPYRGQIAVEDLWDLNVTALDGIFKTLNSRAKEAKEESLLESKSAEDEILDSQIAIVKYIVSVKQQEANERSKAKERKEQKQKIMAIMASKQEETLNGKSIEELQKMLDELN
jgi:hypothetical protein